ncbi:MAG: methyltransferase domain-containing protein [Actinomycetota bacterium]|nr:methyltransferase domain-containing protein [Actinomycetota bacterium]
MVRHVRLREFLVAVEGLALFRTLVEGDDETAATRIDEVRRIVGSEGEGTFGLGADVPEMDPRAGYARWAATYDRPGNPLVTVEQPLVWGLLDALPPGRALDAACGTGRHTAHLLEGGHEVTGVDGSPEMLELARARAPEARFLEGDLRELPVDDGEFDLAVCALALGHFDDLRAPVAELARAVRPGGSIALSDLHPAMSVAGGQALFEAADGNLAFVREHVHLHGEYLDAFADAGLEIVQCIEPRFGAEEAGMQGMAAQFIADATLAAFVGLPGALIWLLRRR